MKERQTRGYEAGIVLDMIFNCEDVEEARHEQENLVNALKKQLNNHYPLRIRKLEIQEP